MISASITITNNTGSPLTFTTVDQVNDDADWSAPAVGSTLQPCASVTISMRNKSVIPPRGVGANIAFTCQINTDSGSIYFDDPAVGAHSFDFGNETVFSYTQANVESDNSYNITVGLVANTSTSWMQNNLGLLGSRSLGKVCIPGSHDAGMSCFGSSTAFAHTCNTQTQTTGILGQLNFGIRYFDIRPVISSGKYFTGHYSHVGAISSWQGANGQSINSLIDDINDYTSNNNELVILNLSHDLNTDLGNDSYASFTQSEWDALFTLMQQGIKNLFVAENPTRVDLTTLTINDFIGSNSAAVVVVVESSSNGISLGNFSNQGFYLGSCSADVYSMLLAGGWRTAAELANMSADDMRNTLIVVLSQNSTDNVPSLQAQTSQELTWHARMYLWLVAAGIRTSSELSAMSLDNQRNGTIVEINKQKGISIGALQAKKNEELMQIACINFNVYNSYSGKNDLTNMSADQLDKMKNNQNSYFLLSWTLTQTDTEAATCSIGGGTYSILDLANIANPQLFNMLYPACNNQCYPNILYVDNVATSIVSSIAMEINSNCG
jgi:hypothetical protein